MRHTQRPPRPSTGRFPGVCGWVNLNLLRPMAPPPPDDFASAALDDACPLELALLGGFWRVKLLKATGGGANPGVSVDECRLPSEGKRVRVTKADSEWLGQQGVVTESKQAGWFHIEFDESDVAPRNFREADFEVVPPPAAGGKADDAMETEAVAGEGPSEPVYTVRLASVSAIAAKKSTTIEGGIVHTHSVSRDQLRPGWTWRSGKWTGRWVPKVKSKVTDCGGDIPTLTAHAVSPTPSHHPPVRCHAPQ